RGTLLSLREVLLGKYIAGLYGCAGILAAALWVSVVAWICGAWQYAPQAVGFTSPMERVTLPWIFFSCVVVVFLTYAFVGALATLFSVVSKRTLGALLSTYFTLGLLYVGWPVLIGVFNNDAKVLLIMTHPLAGLRYSIDPYMRNGLSRGGSLFLFAAGAIVATSVCALLSSRLVERRRGRDP
ncbi:MAG TPA: hypothetical protein VMT52_04060, partial [Planctomycetota bacterium]|nr:hypothetical protein [Planctomycetota bacterium]